MNDAQIRRALIPYVRSGHNPLGLRVIEEFALYGGASRADLVTLNGLSHAYEIKSDRDKLVRLPQQASAYNAVFERVTLVSAPRHIPSARKLIPGWWGIIEAREDVAGSACLRPVRKPRPNPSPDGEAIASLLWRSEALGILASLGLDRGVRSKPMDKIAARLAQELSPEALSRYVRESLRARGEWRSAARLTQCGGMSPRPSSLLGCRRILYGSIYR
jgi:hypothetical protein